jgi:hypothetical protein
MICVALAVLELALYIRLVSELQRSICPCFPSTGTKGIILSRRMLRTVSSSVRNVHNGLALLAYP